MRASTFASLQAVVVDEWHELMGNKRGVQTQLALARLRTGGPISSIWGMSATLGNLEDAKRTLLGPRRAARGALVEGRLDKELVIDTLLPDTPERFPWGGHLGAEDGASGRRRRSKQHQTTLVFTNVRSQAELWYQQLAEAAARLGGRDRAPSRLARRARRATGSSRASRPGSLKAVVCTSSLDLGVDFLPVERVLQIGSPKGVARLLQRAGRSGHAPGRVSRITLVPSQTLELVEAAAVKRAIAERKIESRRSPSAPLDVLAQHCVTVALGGGFRADELLAEVRETAAYEHSERRELGLVPRFRPPGRTEPYRLSRISAAPRPTTKGVWRARRRIRRQAPSAQHRRDRQRHVGHGAVRPGAARSQARHGRGKLHRAHEARATNSGSPAARSNSSRIREGTAFVKASKGGGMTPRWRRRPHAAFDHARRRDGRSFCAGGEGGIRGARRCRRRARMLELQARWSALPTPDTLLAETLKSREGWHLFVYPFAGRDIHLGLASLVAWRAGAREAGTFSLSVNDYGFEVLSATERDWGAELCVRCSRRRPTSPR